MVTLGDIPVGVSQEEFIEVFARHITPAYLIEREQARGIRFGPFHQQWQLERAPEKVSRLLAKAADDPYRMARQGFKSLDFVDPPPTSFTAVANTGTESCLWNTSVTTALQTTWCPIPLGDMRAGKTYECAFGGNIANTGTPTVIFTPRIGPNATAANAANISLGVSPTVTTVSALNHPMYGEFVTVIRSIALTASGATATGNGYVAFGNASAAATVIVMGGSVPTTVDNTVASGFLVNLTWSAASASNTCTCTWVEFGSAN